MVDFTNPMSWAPTVIGAVLGGAGSSGTQTQTVNKDPWGPAQPFLLDNLKSLADQQKFYQQNPFSQQQQDAFNQVVRNNTLFQNNIAPGLLGFSGALMSQQYQRPTGGRPGEGAGYGGPRQAAQTFNPMAGFSKNEGTWREPTPVNFAAMNPYASFIPNLQQQRAAATPPAPAPTTGGGLLNVDRGGGAKNPDTGWGSMSPQERAMWLAENPMIDGIDSFVNSLIDNSAVAGLLSMADPDGDRGWTRMAADSIGPSNPGDNPGPNERGYSPARDSNDAGGDRGDGGDGGNGRGEGSGKGEGHAYAKGGQVKGLLGPNPPGPDDGYAALKKGEYVINKKAAEAIGKKKLDAMNRKGK